MNLVRLSATAGALALVLLPVGGCDAVAIDQDGHADGHEADGHEADAARGPDEDADHGHSSPPLDDAPELVVTAGDLAFAPDELELRADEPVNLQLRSHDVLHDLVVDEVGFHLAAEAGETVTGGLVLDEPGSYTGYCTVAGHRDAGMEMTIIVD